MYKDDPAELREANDPFIPKSYEETQKLIEQGWYAYTMDEYEVLRQSEVPGQTICWDEYKTIGEMIKLQDEAEINS